MLNDYYYFVSVVYVYYINITKYIQIVLNADDIKMNRNNNNKNKMMLFKIIMFYKFGNNHQVSMMHIREDKKKL